MSLQRRAFLRLLALCGIGAAFRVAAAGVEAETAPRTWIEVRHYTFASPEKRDAFAAFAGTVAVPAMNRAGCKPVGVFRLDAADNPKLEPAPAATELYVVIPHETAESIAQLALKLDRDAAYREAGRPFIEAARKEPAFIRMETSLLYAFAKQPRIDVPGTATSRVVQLRTYTSHNEDRALRKVGMFDEGGEIEIFRRTGLHPVFFGRAVSGWAMPNLTYMLSFDSAGQLAENWKVFVNDPEWKKLKTDERYSDTEPSIVNLILRPVEGSQI